MAKLGESLHDIKLLLRLVFDFWNSLQDSCCYFRGQEDVTDIADQLLSIQYDVHIYIYQTQISMLTQSDVDKNVHIPAV